MLTASRNDFHISPTTSCWTDIYMQIYANHILHMHSLIPFCCHVNTQVFFWQFLFIIVCFVFFNQHLYEYSSVERHACSWYRISNLQLLNDVADHVMMFCCGLLLLSNFQFKFCDINVCRSSYVGWMLNINTRIATLINVSLTDETSDIWLSLLSLWSPVFSVTHKWKNYHKVLEAGKSSKSLLRK